MFKTNQNCNYCRDCLVYYFLHCVQYKWVFWEKAIVFFYQSFCRLNSRLPCKSWNSLCNNSINESLFSNVDIFCSIDNKMTLISQSLGLDDNVGELSALLGVPGRVLLEVWVGVLGVFLFFLMVQIRSKQLSINSSKASRTLEKY